MLDCLIDRLWNLEEYITMELEAWYMYGTFGCSLPHVACSGNLSASGTHSVAV
jgi:hypothetical protein